MPKIIKNGIEYAGSDCGLSKFVIFEASNGNGSWSASFKNGITISQYKGYGSYTVGDDSLVLTASTSNERGYFILNYDFSVFLNKGRRLHITFESAANSYLGVEAAPSASQYRTGWGYGYTSWMSGYMVYDLPIDMEITTTNKYLVFIVYGVSIRIRDMYIS